MIPRSGALFAIPVSHGREGDGTTGGSDSTPRDPREIAAAIERRLRCSSYFALREIGCVCREGVVTLQGRLPTYYLKQVALAIADEVAGGLAIQNRIEVTG
jgi:osmotically-inducible protein OsmY